MNEKVLFGVVGGVVAVSVGLFIYASSSTSGQWAAIDSKIGKVKPPLSTLVKQSDKPPERWGPTSDSIATQLENVLTTDKLLENLEQLRGLYETEVGVMKTRAGQISTKLATPFGTPDPANDASSFRAAFDVEAKNLQDANRAILANDTFVSQALRDEKVELEQSRSLNRDDLIKIQKKFRAVEAFIAAAKAAGVLRIVDLKPGKLQEPVVTAHKPYVLELGLKARVLIPFEDSGKLIAALLNSDVYFRVDSMVVDKALLDDLLAQRSGKRPESPQPFWAQKTLISEFLWFRLPAAGVSAVTNDSELQSTLPCEITLDLVALDAVVTAP